MNIPADLKYTKDHEWARIEDDIATVGITDFAQGELGDIVYVEAPSVGSTTEQGVSCGSIEAVKAVSDLFAPLSGEVVEVNSELESNPQIINQDTYGKGWILKIKLSDAGEADKLLAADAYEQLIG